MTDRIIQFLIQAKQSTYAGQGTEVQPFRVGSHDLLYREGDLMYYDSYFGGERFAGQEVLWIAENPYWSMNYIGRVTGLNFDIVFLKEALLHVPVEMPCRGPTRYDKGDYSYSCAVSGTFEWFQGHEVIFYKGAEIYDCHFHGGLIAQ